MASSQTLILGTVLAIAGGSAGCNIENLLNQTASFGGDTAGQRSSFTYVVINNTPFRAIFTAGAYDDLVDKFKKRYARKGAAKAAE